MIKNSLLNKIKNTEVDTVFWFFLQILIVIDRAVSKKHSFFQLPKIFGTYSIALVSARVGKASFETTFV